MTSSGKRLRIALFGSPAFAVPTLEALHAQHELLLVVTQPAKPAGRGMHLRQPAAARRATDLGVPTDQPRRLGRDQAFERTLRQLDLDVAVTAAYGKLLPAGLLCVPQYGFLNVHASLLPKYRGAAPIQWALIHGERETGVSIMQTEAGLDTGPVRFAARRAIGPHETAIDLFPALAEIGARTVLEALELLARGALPSVPQDDAAATQAPLLRAGDGRIRWEDSATAVYDRYRGVIAWPGSYFQGEHGERVKLTGMRPADRAADRPTDPSADPATDRPADPSADPAADHAADPSPPHAATPGAVLRVLDGSLLIACGEGSVWLERLRPAGRQEMTAAAWAHGRGVQVGARLG